MNSSPRLGVLVSTVSRPHYLQLSLESLSNQTRTDFTAIVINNGGDDETQAVIDSWSQRTRIESMLRRFASNSPGNLFGELDIMDYLLILGDDDTLTPTAIQCVLDAIQAAPDAPFVSFASQVMGPLGWRVPATLRPCGVNSSWQDFMGRLLMDSCLILSATAFSTDALRRGGFDYARYDYSCDWLMYLACASQGMPELSDQIILNTRVHNRQHWSVATPDLVRQQTDAMLTDFVFSETFANFINQQSLADCRILLNSMTRYLRSQRIVRERDLAVYAAVRLQMAARQATQEGGEDPAWLPIAAFRAIDGWIAPEARTSGPEDIRVGKPGLSAGLLAQGRLSARAVEARARRRVFTWIHRREG